MQEIVNKQKCSGCCACYNICPVSCISMEYDEEGFLYPVIDNSKCVDCGMCKKICPVLKEYSGNVIGKAYACMNKNETVRVESSSGGVFSLVAEQIIDEGGVVFGAAFDRDFSVKHICIQSKEEIYKLRGSKYLQSNVSDTYKEAKVFLEQRRLVLFSGTPCQISGLKAYLQADYDNLIVLDLVCHGVPSQKAFNRYLDQLQRCCDAAITEQTKIKFRDKFSGWYGYSVSVKFDESNIYYKKHTQDLFMRAFLNNLCLRPSCYNCHSKSLNRQSDITLADFWGVKEQLPEMFDNKGTSLVLVNSEKGRKIFEEIKDKMIVSKVDFDKAVKRNTAAYKSCKMPKERKKFMTSLDTTDFKTNVEACVKSGVIIKIKRLIKRGIRYVQK